MIIKKFTAKTENEAIANAKKELGEGVVVMNVKDIKPKGLFAFLRPHTVEVTVALEEESEKYTAAVSAINNVVVSSQSKETPVIPEPVNRLRRRIQEKKAVRSRRSWTACSRCWSSSCRSRTKRRRKRKTRRTSSRRSRKRRRKLTSS